MRDRGGLRALMMFGTCIGACRSVEEPLDSASSALTPVASGAPSSGARARAADPWANDPLSLEQLAATQRAPELLRRFETGDADGALALLALARAEDVEIVQGRLAELAADRTRDDRREILAVLRDVAYRRPSRTERLSPESLAKCIAILRRLAADPTDAPALRALAETVVNASVRNGLAPQSVPVPSGSPSAAPTASAATTKGP